jgi:hypothetical protein
MTLNELDDQVAQTRSLYEGAFQISDIGLRKALLQNYGEALTLYNSWLRFHNAELEAIWRRARRRCHDFSIWPGSPRP